VVLADHTREGRLGALLELVREELNVREVRLAAEADRFVSFRVKPDFKALGARLGKDMKAVAGALAQMDGGEVRRQALAGALTIAGHTLGSSDVLVEVVPKPGFRAAGSANAVVALHTDLDEDLLEEGLMREIVARVQGARKQLGVGYSDQVHVGVDGGPRTTRVLARYATALAEVARCRLGAPEADAAEATVDGETFRISVTR
jgi:isoleucyl-tRNA synthetase